MPVLKLLRLPPGDVRVLCEATVVVTAVRMSLWWLPFGSVRAIADRLARPGARRRAIAPEPIVERVVWAVRAAAARVPRATCLTQALAARLMLERRGLSAALRIGVARAADERVEGHAWLECQGRIVIGEAEAARYAPLDRS
jgi:transglutaminase superfamily protein